MKLYVIILFLLISVITLAQEWTPVGPFYGQRKNGSQFHSMGLVSAVWMNPADTNEIIIGTNSSGLWKTNNNGLNWRCLTDKKRLVPSLGITSIVQHPTKPNFFLASAGNFVYGDDTYGGCVLISKDAGNSWDIWDLYKNPNWKAPVVKVEFTSLGTIVVATSKQIVHTKDEGKHWDVIFKLDEKLDYVKTNGQDLVDFSILDEEKVLVSSSQKWGNSGQLWSTADFGKTWVDLYENETLSGVKGNWVQGTKLSEVVDSVIYVGVSLKNTIVLYKSGDKAVSFEKVGVIKKNHETGDGKATKFEIEVSKQDPNKVYLGFVEFFEWTKKRGLKLLSPTANITSEEHDDVRSLKVYLKKGKDVLLMGNDGGVSFYYPNEKRFKSINGKDLNTLQVYNMGLSQEKDYKILIGTQDNGTFTYTTQDDWYWMAGGDGGASWLSKDGRKQFYSVNASLMFFEGVRRKYFSPNKNRSGWFLDFPANVKRDEKTLVFGSKKKKSAKGAIFYTSSTDGRRTNDIGVEIDRMQKIGEIEVSDNDDSLLYIASADFNGWSEKRPRLVKSTDGGKVFLDITDKPVYADNYSDTTSLLRILDYRYISDAEIDKHNSDIVYISLTGVYEKTDWVKPFERYRVLKSRDGGESWIDYSDGLPDYPAFKIIKHNGSKELLFCGTDDGVYYKTKKMSKWEVLGNGFPMNITCTDLKINYCTNELFASTYGRSVWKVSIPQYNKFTEKIKEHTLYDSTVSFLDHNIMVKKKKTLTIKHNLRLGKDVKIILAPKATLVIDGCKVTDASMEGRTFIEKQEKKFLFFFKRKRGKVKLENEGKIIQ